MARFAFDTFTEVSNTTLASHTADDGGTWTKHTSFATAAQVIGSEDRVQGGSTSAASQYYHSGVPASADYDVYGTLRTTSTGNSKAYPSIAGRITTSSNDGYFFSIFADTNNTFLLLKRVAGVQTTLGNYVSAPTVNTDYPSILRMHGTTIEAWLNGANVLTATDAALTAKGVAGLRVRTNGRIDDFQAIDAAAVVFTSIGVQ